MIVCDKCKKPIERSSSSKEGRSYRYHIEVDQFDTLSKSGNKHSYVRSWDICYMCNAGFLSGIKKYGDDS